MKYDVWFCRHQGQLYSVCTAPGEAPETPPRKVSTAARTLDLLKANGHTVTQVGICTPDMIGIE